MLFKDSSEEQLQGTREAISKVDDERLVDELAVLLDPVQAQTWEIVEETNPGYVGWWIRELSKELARRGIDPIQVINAAGPSV